MGRQLESGQVVLGLILASSQEHSILERQLSGLVQGLRLEPGCCQVER